MNEHSARSPRTSRPRSLACCAAALVIIATGPVLGQSAQLGELTDRIERLQRELQTLQRTVYRGAKPPPIGGAKPPIGAAAPAPNTGFAATVEVRLSEFENLVRGLEQRIETLEIAEHRAKGRFKRMAADLEHRLRTFQQSQALRTPPMADADGLGASAALATTIIGGTAAPDAPPRPLGTLRLSKDGKAPMQAGRQVAAAAPVLPEGDPKEQYDYALSLILNGQDFAKAEKAFKTFIERHPKHDLSGNAYFWLGQTHFVRKEFQNAAFAFADGFQKFPRSSKAPENLYKLGMSLGRLGKAREACTAFSRLLETFPETNRNLKTRISRQRKRLKCT